MSIVRLVGPLAPGEMHLLRVDHDHMVTAIHVRRKLRTMLAPQARSHGSRKAAQNHAVGIDENPAMFYVAGTGAVGAHGDLPAGHPAICMADTRVPLARYLPVTLRHALTNGGRA